MICGAVLGERLVATFGLQVRWCFMPVAPLVALAVCVHELQLHHAHTSRTKWGFPNIRAVPFWGSLY